MKTETILKKIRKLLFLLQVIKAVIELVSKALGNNPENSNKK